MSKLLADQIANYDDNGPIEIKEGLNIASGKPIQIAGSAGSNGNVLVSNGTTVSWSNALDNSSNWDDAHGWGNHAAAGYSTTDTNTTYAQSSVADGSNVNVVSIDLRQASDTGFLTLSTGEKTDVCMDMWNSNPYRTYTSGTDTTRVFLPFTHISGKTLAVLALGGYIGGALGATDASVGSILQPTVAGSAGSEYVDISGDYRGKNLIIGYLYTMTVDLPRFYYSTTAGDALRTDYTSDLIMHRIKVSTGLSGPVKYNVNLTGIPDRSQTVSVIQPAAYQLNDVAMAADAVHTVPIHQRNENVSLSIVGDTPLPVTLLGMNWEGKYTNKFYSRI